jgi:hypothetical protein
MKRHIGIIILAWLCLAPSLSLLAAPRAFEVGPRNKEALPGGKEADGILGDFVLRNDVITAVISGNLPLRRANMSTFYGAGGITPGCLYDLTFVDQPNDQITIFAPAGQQGPVSWVRVAKDGSDGEAVVETVVTSANNNGLYKRHEYRLQDGWQGLLIVTTLRNESPDAKSGKPNDRWTNFSSTGTAREITWADAVDPADRAGYAYAWVDKDGFQKPPADLKLQPGQEITFARFLAVGHSPAEAVGLVAARREPTGVLEGTILAQTDGHPLKHPKVELPLGGKTVPAYPDPAGQFRFPWPEGTFDVAFGETGRPTVHQTVNIHSGQSAQVSIRLGPASTLAFDITGEDGHSLPCKAQFIGVDGTPSPNLGPQNRAHGCKDQYHSEIGQFEVQVPPGKYKVVVTHGIEFNHAEEIVTLAAGESHRVKHTLKRIVDTSGWISADFHNHSTPSGDNTCGTDDRLINLAAEQIEFAPTTEHNRLFNWQPYIERLGLAEELATVPGIELTGSGAHFNSFPFKPVPLTQDNGAPVWNKDPRMSALTLRDFQGLNADRWLQVNHPDMVEDFIDRDGDGRADGGYVGLGRMLDAVETLNGKTAGILAGAPIWINKDKVNYNGEFIWLQLLNRGARYWCVAVSDAHSVYGNGVGGWRMFVKSSTDQPARIDWREISRNAKAGKIVVSTGPYLEVTAEDGTIAGGSTRATDHLNFHVKVQCTDWIEIDRVQVLVNGRADPRLNYTRQSHPEWFRDGVVRFDQMITVPLSQDSHLIVVACGEHYDLSTGFGSSPQAKWRPCAYNNPIFADVDGGGFQPNGDTLGFALPVKKISLEEARTMLGTLNSKN